MTLDEKLHLRMERGLLCYYATRLYTLKEFCKSLQILSRDCGMNGNIMHNFCHGKRTVVCHRSCLEFSDSSEHLYSYEISIFVLNDVVHFPQILFNNFFVPVQ